MFKISVFYIDIKNNPPEVVNPAVFFSVLYLPVQVSVPEPEVKVGMALQPALLEVSLVDQPITDLLFTQFMASVSGKVHCIGERPR